MIRATNGNSMDGWMEKIENPEKPKIKKIKNEICQAKAQRRACTYPIQGCQLGAASTARLTDRPNERKNTMSNALHDRPSKKKTRSCKGLPDGQANQAKC